MRMSGLVLLAMIISFVGCSAGWTYWNEHIDAETRAQIKSMNERVIDALYENDPRKLEALLSDKLKEKAGSQLSDFVIKAHEAFRTKEYSLLDECSTRNTAVGSVATVRNGISGENDYKVNFEVINKETYLSFILSDGKANNALLTCVYGKYGDEWKLNILQIGDYSFFGKNAIAFFKQGVSNYENGNLIDAVDDIEMAKRTALPANQVLHYQMESKIKDFETKLLSEASAKFPLPMKIAEVGTSPEIYGVRPFPMNEGVYPMVIYVSKISLQDTIALKKENEELKKSIGKIFPGIDKGKKFVFFQAYNEIPDGKKKTRNYGFVMRLNEVNN
jgi:hypothetical protein